MKLHQNQIVYLGTTKGIITSVSGQSVNVHLIDGRYRLNANVNVFFFHPYWTVTNKKATFEEATSYIKASTKLKCNYVVKCSTRIGAVFVRQCFSSSASKLSDDLVSQGLTIINFSKSDDQIVKPVVLK